MLKNGYIFFDTGKLKKDSIIISDYCCLLHQLSSLDSNMQLGILFSWRRVAETKEIMPDCRLGYLHSPCLFML